MRKLILITCVIMLYTSNGFSGVGSSKSNQPSPAQTETKMRTLVEKAESTVTTRQDEVNQQKRKVLDLKERSKTEKNLRRTLISEMKSLKHKQALLKISQDHHQKMVTTFETFQKTNSKLKMIHEAKSRKK